MDSPVDRLEWLPAAGRPEQLILLLHGWRSDGRAMTPLAEALRRTFPQAAVLAPDSPTLFVRGDAADERARGDGGEGRVGDESRGGREGREGREGRTSGREPGRLWYSIEGITQENWPGRVAACLPALTAWVRAQQRRLGVAPAATALGGFSQGAVLALAAVLHEDGLAGRVLAFGGSLVLPPASPARLAPASPAESPDASPHASQDASPDASPAAAPQLTTVHLFHGGTDDIFGAERAREALQWFADRQGDATLDIAEGVGHELHPALIDCALHRLTHHIPLRTWRAALGAAPPGAVQ